MRKKICLLLVFVMLAAMLGGCALFCKHEWEDATCEEPATCEECGKTEGEPLGHDWQDATCEEPEYCEECGEERGEPLGHDWQDATCDAPKTCSVCGEEEGEALGHTWEEATTEEPKYCTVCQVTEGEPLNTDPRFTTAATKELQGTWVTYVDMDGEMMGLPDFETAIGIALYCEFTNVGELNMYAALEDEEAFNTALVDYVVDMTYAELAAAGYDAEAAQEAMVMSVGMTIEEYAALSVESLNVADILVAFESNMYYYVEDGLLYSGLYWDGEFTSEGFEIKDGVLTMESTYLEDPADPLQWTFVEE